MTTSTKPCTYGPNMTDLDAYRRAGVLRMRGIRYTDAGAGDQGAAAQQAAADAAAAAGGASPADAAAAASTTAAQATAAGEQAGADGTTVDTTGWPQAAIDAYTKAQANSVKYQREAGDSRINAKATAAAEARKGLLADLTKVLDPDAAAGAEPTVESLTTAVQGKDSTIAELQRTNAAVAAAWSEGIDPAKLGFVQYQLSLDKAFGALDPTADDFGDKVKASIAALVAKDATLKLPGAAVASGVENLGGANGSAAVSQEAFNKMAVSERSKLYNSDKALYDKLVAGQS